MLFYKPFLNLLPFLEFQASHLAFPFKSITGLSTIVTAHGEEGMFRIQVTLHGSDSVFSAASHTAVNVSYDCLLIKAIQVQQLLVRRPRLHLLHILCHLLKLCLQIINDPKRSHSVLLIHYSKLTEEYYSKLSCYVCAG